MPACGSDSGPGGSGGDPGNPFTSTDDGLVNDTEVVATLTMEAPESRDFILSATLPVPPGTFTDGALTVPLSVAGHGDIASPTQVEIVSRYPDAADGADVVQILAHVRRPDPVEVGDTIEFKVGLNPHQRYELELEPAIETLLDSPGSIKLVSKDPFGHEYSADLLSDYRDGEGAEIQMDGVCARRVRTHEVLLPNQTIEGANATLPHLMGVHSFLTVYRGQDFATLDLHVHNGMDGRDNSTPTDDLLDDLYFRNLELQLPQGFEVAYAFDRPGQGETVPAGSSTVTELVQPMPGGQVHLMPRLSHFVRRLVITKSSSALKAHEQARSKYVAFCQPGMAPVGVEQWSWWNEDTGRYYAQNQPLPELGYIGLPEVQARLEGELDRFETQYASGEAGLYPYTSPRLGWAHPWSVAHSGMPGGHEINTFAGVETAWAASREGFRMTQLRMGAMVDRTPNVLFDKTGEHTRYETLVEYPENRDPYVPLWWFCTPTPGNVYFDFGNAQSNQVSFVNNQAMQPSYAGALRSYMPSDYQHYIRYTHDLKTQAWLNNDALAKELLEAAAENFRLGFHEYPNSNYGDFQPTGLGNAMASTLEHPGMGVPMGRGEAWGIDSALAVYAFGDTNLRQRYRHWFDKISDVFENGQSTCTGNLMSYHIWNHFNGEYRVRQAMENAFLENTLMGMATTVYENVDETQTASLQQIIVDSVRCSMSGRFFNEVEGAPYFNNATGPRDITLGNFCESSPAGTTSPGVNRTEYYSSLAYAYKLSGDSFFLFRASQMLGGGDILAGLENNQGQNMVNTAALIQLAQSMADVQP